MKYSSCASHLKLLMTQPLSTRRLSFSIRWNLSYAGALYSSEEADLLMKKVFSIIIRFFPRMFSLSDQRHSADIFRANYTTSYALFQVFQGKFNHLVIFAVLFFELFPKKGDLSLLTLRQNRGPEHNIPQIYALSFRCPMRHR